METPEQYVKLVQSYQQGTATTLLMWYRYLYVWTDFSGVFVGEFKSVNLG